MAYVTLETPSARLELDPEVGGSVASFRWRGHDVLRAKAHAPSSASGARAHASFPLLPFSNRIAHATVVFEGRSYPLARNFGDHPHAIHGVGWQRAWLVDEHTETRARLTCDHDPARGGADEQAWPWSFAATQTFSLGDEAGGAVTLTQRLALRNTGATVFPFGLGWHPYFSRSATSVLGFAADGVWLTDDTKLPVAHRQAVDAYRFDPPRPVAEAVLDNVFTGWKGEATLDDPGRAMRVRIAADSAAAFLIVYIPRDEPHFLAIEPATHMTDAFNRAARGERDTGTRVLGPGAAFSTTMSIRVSPWS